MKIVNIINILSVLFFISACGGGRHVVEETTQIPGPQGAPGKNGADGTNGQDGSNGYNSLISIVTVAPACLNGGIIVMSGLDTNDNNQLDSGEVENSEAVCNGLNGDDGNNGANGLDGHNALVDLVGTANGGGASCDNGGLTLLAGTDLNDNGILELSEATQSKDVCNGLNGINGQDAQPNDFEITELLDPCGDAPGVFDEVLLQLGNGSIIASFSENMNGKNTRFVSIPEGNYITTDGTNCNFSVDANLNVSW